MHPECSEFQLEHLMQWWIVPTSSRLSVVVSQKPLVRAITKDDITGQQLLKEPVIISNNMKNTSVTIEKS